MNKKMLAVLAALVVAAAGVILMRGSGPLAPAPEILGAEAALPKFAADQNYVLAKVQNTEGLRRGVRFLKEFMPLMEDPDVIDGMRAYYEDLGMMDPTDTLDTFYLAMKYVTLFDAFVTAADEIALLGVSPDVCMAFFTNEEKYAAMKTAFETAGNAPEPWTTELAGEGAEALLLRAPLEEGGGTLHVLKRGDGARTQVLVANSEETMGRAVRAWENEADRAVITRGLDAPNFLQYRMSIPGYGDIPSRDVASETAWLREGNTTKIESFSDLPALGITPVTSGKEGGALPLFGSGEPFIIAAVDLPYFFSLAMPGEENPVDRFISLMEASAGQRIPSQFRGDVIAVLSGSRLTAGVFMNSGDVVPETAYIALEMKSPDILGKYYALAGMLMAPAQVEGWESVLSQSVDDGVDVTLARSGDLMLFGFGSPEAYGTRADYPAAMAGMLETGVIIASYIAPKFLTDENTAFGAMFRESLTHDEDGREVAGILDKLNLGAFESIATVQADPTRGECRIVWSEQ